MRKLVSFLMAVAITFSSFATLVRADAETDKPDWQFSAFQRSTTTPVIAGAYSYRSTNGFKSGTVYNITSPIFKGRDGVGTIMFAIDFKYSINILSGKTWAIVTDIYDVTAGASLGVVSVESGTATSTPTTGADTYWESGETSYPLDDTHNYQVRITATTNNTNSNTGYYVKIDDIVINTDLILLGPSGHIFPDFSLTFEETPGSPEVFQYSNGQVFGALFIKKNAVTVPFGYDSSDLVGVDVTVNRFKVNRSTGEIVEAVYSNVYFSPNFSAEIVDAFGTAIPLRNATYDYIYSLSFISAGTYNDEIIGVAQPALPTVIGFAKLAKFYDAASGKTTSTDACSTSLTGSLPTYFMKTVGGVSRFYYDLYLTSPINGGGKWWATMDEATGVKTAYKVDASGNVTGTATCP